MTASKREVYAALAMSVVALAVGVAALARGRSAAPTASSCVDAQARATLDQLRREVAAADARALSRLGPTSPPTPTPVPAAPSADAPASTANAAAAPASTGAIRRYARIEAADPAVTVVQLEDGTYDIKTKDPSLAGSVVVARATTPDGRVDQLMIHVP